MRENVIKAAKEQASRVNSLADLASDNVLFPTAPFSSQEIAQPWTFAEGSAYTPFTLNRIALSYGYMTYGLVQAVIDVVVEDAFRGGLVIESKELDEEDLKELRIAMEESGDIEAIKNTIKWGRLFGGSGLIVVTDQDPRKPLRDIEKDAELRFVAADRWELQLLYLSISGQQYNVDPRQDNLIDAPFNYYGIQLDPSRVVRFLGKDAPSFIRQRLQGWGMSELERCIREINSYIKFQNLLFEIVDEAKIDIYKIEAFNDSLATAQGTALIQTRINLSNMIKNYKNALVMDMKDDYEQKQLAFSGLADIFEEFRISLAAALKIPLNKLFGQASTGFASGEDSMENYNGMVESDVREKAKPLCREAVKLRCMAKFGFEPEFTVGFKPLRTLTEVEEETVKTSKQGRAMDLYDRDLLDGQETMESLHKSELLNVDSAVLDGTREPISPLEMQSEAQDTAAQHGEKKLKIDEKKAGAKKTNALLRLATMLGERNRRRAA